MSKEFVWTDELVKEFAYNWLDDNFEKFKVGESRLEKFKESKTKKPVLFTTEDGVDIEQGNPNDIWRVFITPSSYEAWKPIQMGIPQYINSKDEKYFYYKKSAEEYILMNKPCLSIADVYNLCIALQFHNRVHDRADEDYYAVYVDLLYKRLKELAKTKIK